MRAITTEFHLDQMCCERCHGIGYVSTALGKLPCLACSAAENQTGELKQKAVSPITNYKEGTAS